MLNHKILAKLKDFQRPEDYAKALSDYLANQAAIAAESLAVMCDIITEGLKFDTERDDYMMRRDTLVSLPATNGSTVSMTMQSFYLLITDALRRKSSISSVSVGPDNQIILAWALEDVTTGCASTTLLSSALSCLNDAYDSFTYSDVISKFKTDVGSVFDRVESLAANIGTMISDRKVSKMDKLESIIDVIANDALTVDEDNDPFTDYVIQHHAENFSGDGIENVWTITTFGSVMNAIANTAVKVVVAVGLGVWNILKAGWSLLKKGWNKYIVPSFISKDFIDGDKDSSERHADIPIISSTEFPVPKVESVVSAVTASAVIKETELGDLSVRTAPWQISISHPAGIRRYYKRTYSKAECIITLDPEVGAYATNLTGEYDVPASDNLANTLYIRYNTTSSFRLFNTLVMSNGKKVSILRYLSEFDLVEVELFCGNGRSESVKGWFHIDGQYHDLAALEPSNLSAGDPSDIIAGNTRVPLVSGVYAEDEVRRLTYGVNSWTYADIELYAPKLAATISDVNTFGGHEEAGLSLLAYTLNWRAQHRLGFIRDYTDGDVIILAILPLTDEMADEAEDCIVNASQPDLDLFHTILCEDGPIFTTTADFEVKQLYNSRVVRDVEAIDQTMGVGVSSTYYTGGWLVATARVRITKQDSFIERDRFGNPLESFEGVRIGAYKPGGVIQLAQFKLSDMTVGAYADLPAASVIDVRLEDELGGVIASRTNTRGDDSLNVSIETPYGDVCIVDPTFFSSKSDSIELMSVNVNTDRVNSIYHVEQKLDMPSEKLWSIKHVPHGFVGWSASAIRDRVEAHYLSWLDKGEPIVVRNSFASFQMVGKGGRVAGQVYLNPTSYKFLYYTEVDDDGIVMVPRVYHHSRLNHYRYLPWSPDEDPEEFLRFADADGDCDCPAEGDKWEIIHDRSTVDDLLLELISLHEDVDVEELTADEDGDRRAIMCLAASEYKTVAALGGLGGSNSHVTHAVGLAYPTVDHIPLPADRQFPKNPVNTDFYRLCCGDTLKDSVVAAESSEICAANPVAAIVAGMWHYYIGIILNKKDIMTMYNNACGMAPGFTPYSASSVLGPARWHVNTDDEISSYAQRMFTGLVVASLLIVAAVCIGIAASKMKKNAKLNKIKRDAQLSGMEWELSQKRREHDAAVKAAADFKKDMADGKLADTPTSQLVARQIELDSEALKIKEQLDADTAAYFKARKRANRLDKLCGLAASGSAEAVTDSQVAIADIVAEGEGEPTADVEEILVDETFDMKAALDKIEKLIW